jgi:hypothetical protein
MKLLHIVRGIPDHGIAFNIFDQHMDPIRLHRSPMAISSRPLEEGRSNFSKEAEFVLVDDRDVDAALAALAEQNPGYEVRVYGLEKVGQCPAAPMVVKEVTAHGVLPSMKKASGYISGTMPDPAGWARVDGPPPIERVELGWGEPARAEVDREI